MRLGGRLVIADVSDARVIGSARREAEAELALLVGTPAPHLAIVDQGTGREHSHEQPLHAVETGFAVEVADIDGAIVA